jgi:hypothetical protein
VVGSGEVGDAGGPVFRPRVEDDPKIPPRATPPTMPGSVSPSGMPATTVSSRAWTSGPAPALAAIAPSNAAASA